MKFLELTKKEIIDNTALLIKMDGYESGKLEMFNDDDLLNVQINDDGSVEVFE